MASLQEIRQLCLAEYGLLTGYFGAEDEEFPMPLMQDWINQEHRHLARETLCYRDEQTYTIPIGSSGLSVVNLECNVIKIVRERKVRAYLSGTWVELFPGDEQALERRFGMFDNLSNDQPCFYFLRTGNTLDAQRQLVCVPGATAAIASGLKVPAYIYPAEMTAETQGPGMQPGEQPALTPRVCRRMAASQIAKGVGAERALAHFTIEANRLTEDLRQINQESRRAGVRAIIDTSDDYAEGWV